MAKKIKTEEDVRPDFDAVEAELQKKYGKGVIQRLSSKNIEKIPVIPTGSIALDIALGVGGLPRGRIIEIFGKPSCGKTTLCLSVVKECQRAGGKVVWIDMENCFDASWAVKLGIDLEALVFSQPNSANEALDIMKMYVESGSADLVILDSVASLACTAEIEGEVGDSHIGLLARLMSQTLKNMNIRINKTKTCVIMCNQVRSNINTFGFGDKFSTPGGNALPFYASVRLDMARIETIKKADNPIGVKIKAKVVKNKVAIPFTSAEYCIYFDEGVSKTADIMSLGKKCGAIKQKGAWFEYNNKNIAQGEEGLRKFLIDNPELTTEIQNKILAVYLQSADCVV